MMPDPWFVYDPLVPYADWLNLGLAVFMAVTYGGWWAWEERDRWMG